MPRRAHLPTPPSAAPARQSQNYPLYGTKEFAEEKLEYWKEKLGEAIVASRAWEKERQDCIEKCLSWKKQLADSEAIEAKAKADVKQMIADAMAKKRQSEEFENDFITIKREKKH